MAASDATATILKILTGVQSGVDVLLVDGDYTLGSGDDDDIQIFDVSLKQGHARLRVIPGKIEIAGAAGELRTRNGVFLEAQGELQEIEPLDIVSAGTTRFALGPRNGNWASIVEANDDVSPHSPRRIERAAVASVAWWRSWYAALPIAAVLALVGGGVWLAPLARTDRTVSAEQIARGELDSVRTAVNAFDFGKTLAVEQEVDGVIYVTGFVDTPVQRRAIMAAVQKTEVPARVRLPVLESMRSEIANLIAEEKVQLDFSLAGNGQLTLGGTILDSGKAARVTGLMSERVPGLSSVVSNIRTAPSLLADVKGLAGRSQIEPLVIFRLDADLIEASGVLPTEKIDAWVGFLQAYATQYADQIPLRSLVRLQNPDGTLVDAPSPSDKALLLGAGFGQAGDMPLDVSKLQNGQYQLGDVFVGQARMPGASGGLAENDSVVAAVADAATDAVSGVAASARRTGGSLRSILGVADGGTATGSGGPQIRVVGNGQTWTPSALGSQVETGSEISGRATGVASPTDNASSNDADAPVLAFDRDAGSADTATRLARRLIRLWQDGKLPDDEQGRRLREGMNALQQGQVTSGSPSIAFDPIGSRYASLLASSGSRLNDNEQCWPGSKLALGTVGGALFWLDLLSVSRDMSLNDLEAEMQPAVLDAALNPQQTNACASRGGQPARSVYVYEINRNPTFVRFITRQLPAFPLDVAGADIVRGRYIQTRDGRKMREGAAPDESSRLSIVGELGIAVEKNDGYATVIFGDAVNWLVR